MYRKLKYFEIETLIKQQCKADNWDNIEVDENFNCNFLESVHFSGHNKIGRFYNTLLIPNGQKLHSGIYNAKIHNCIINDNVYISNIHNVISNYEIGSNSFISNIGTLSCKPDTSFGNGTKVAVLNETGGREIPIFDLLSSHIAHILVFYPTKRELTGKITEQIYNYTEQQKLTAKGIIGQGAKLVNCNTIINVKIGDSAVINGVAHLENGSINSREDAQSVIGSGVIAKSFIVSSSSKVFDNAIIERCFVGEGCIIEKSFSAVDSIIFSNCEFANGEAASMFAGPYTVSHHKSSLVIACNLSFANIGSCTNMSNHAYKLGAIHQSVIERGCKFGSNSYILSPTHIGRYTMILGSHKNHPDTHELPFSYLLEEKEISILAPGINMFRIGTLRDIYKWERRDRRQGNKHLDYISYNLINPLTINKVDKAIKLINNLIEKNKDTEIDYVTYKNCRITKRALNKAIKYYQEAITVLVGSFLLNQNQRNNLNDKIDCSQWIDLGGLIMPKSKIEELTEMLDRYYSSMEEESKEENAYESPKYEDKEAEDDNSEQKEEEKSKNSTVIFFDMIDKFLCEIHESYNDYLEAFITARYGIISEEVKCKILEEYINTMKTISIRLKKEADSEFFGSAQIGYGIDFEEDKDADFKHVIGTIEDNEFINMALSEIDRRTKQAKEYVEKSQGK